MKRAVFLDRDGTLIREVGYLSTLEDLEVLPGVASALRRLGEAGYLRLVVTNQSGVARGYFSLRFVEAAHRELRRRLQRQGADIEGFYVCPHHPEFTGACECRKPNPGLVLRAAGEWGVDLASSWVVGDKVADVELGRRAGCRTGVVRSGYGGETARDLTARGVRADVVGEDLGDVAEAMLGTNKGETA